MGFSLIGLGGGKRNTPQTKGEKQGALVKLFAIILFLVFVGCFLALYSTTGKVETICFGVAVGSLVISLGLSGLAGWFRKLDIQLSPEQREKAQEALKKYEYKYFKKAEKKFNHKSNKELKATKKAEYKEAKK